MHPAFDPDKFIANVGDAILAVDRDGKVILWNAGAERLFGYPADQVIGRSMDFFIPEESPAPHWDGFHQVMRSGKTHLGTNIIRVPAIHNEGHRIRIALTVAILRNDDQQIESIGAIVREEVAPKQTAAQTPP